MENGIQLVEQHDGRIVTTSLKVAEHFEKQHKDVIRAIENLLKDQDVFNRRNFTLVDYADSKGESRPMYEMDRDGFSLLAMGFTGKKALQFKLSYIDAFNKAEQMLSNIPALPADPIMAQIAVLQNVRESQLALEAQQQVIAIGIAETRQDVNHLKQNMRVENWQQCNIKKAVDGKIAEFRDLYPSINVSDCYRKVWRYFKGKFQIPRYQELPAMMYEEGMKTIHSMAMHNLAGL